MATGYHSNTDHWSKMRMNVSKIGFHYEKFFFAFKVIKNTINTEQRGRVLSWEKHKKMAVQRELEAAIHGTRSLPEHHVGVVHNFQDVLTNELEEFVPGRAYFRRQAERNLGNKNESKKEMAECK
jgi:hypothetical protein